MKNAGRQSRTRLQTLGAAQLAQIAGGVHAVEYVGAIAAVTAAVLEALVARP